MLKNIRAFLTLSVLLVTPTLALADSNTPRGQQLACSGTLGAPVITVEVKLLNDADSGIAGNYWALDTLERLITVWKTATPGEFCATVKDEGGFKTFAGQRSPGNTAVLTGQERGRIRGGYVATITGTLRASPLWKTHGDIGTVDYRCDVNGTCPGYVSWVGQYFDPVVTFDQPAWGWTYLGGRFGTWVNALSGNTGDISPAAKGADIGHDD